MNRLGTIGKVLQLKENREGEIECEVRSLRNAVGADQARLAILETSYMETLETFNRKQHEGRLAPAEMGIYYSYLFHLNKEMEAKRRTSPGQCRSSTRGSVHSPRRAWKRGSWSR